jgi:hypothetical protein
MIQPAIGRFEIRCHSCSHRLGAVGVAMRLAGLFRPTAFGQLPTQEGEVRKVCRKCRWVNIFEPADHRSSERLFELKRPAA